MRHGKAWILLGLLVTGIVYLPGAAAADDAATIGPRGVLHPAVDRPEPPVTPSASEQELKEVAERLDTHGLLYTGKVVVDTDRAMLEPPEVVADAAGKEYTMAAEPPTIEFTVLPVEPLFLGESPAKSKSSLSNEPAPWANWGQSAYDAHTGKFYSSVGDDGKYDAHLYIIEYDPAIKAIKTFPEVNKVLGRDRTMFGEGKIHGWLDWYQAGYLDKPHLWFCTYWVKYPEPDEEDFATGYNGGHIMSLDVATGDMVDYGVPVKRSSWPYHRVDTKRGIMYAVGMFGEFLAWDINEQRTLWAGYLPEGMGWWERCLMIDEETGMVYTSNRDDEADPELHMLKYDLAKNRFFKLDCHMPASTGSTRKGGDAGTVSPLRAQTPDRGPDDLFWCVTSGGQLFTFDPETEEIVDKGPNWAGIERYTCSMQRSPGGRYIYYCPGAHGHGYSDGSPIVQYDTQTGGKKVLAFLFPYYYEKYGYTPGGTFSIKLDDKGERLFILWNGAFIEHEGDVAGGDTFGQCSLMLVHIPASERKE
ncbi:MAG: hypothetical protein KJ052_06535 [Candidatus Hydrogenedentes bacterium]|nr:hypothetical protein [Candidatus Hydrogenedentota bacterium]